MDADLYGYKWARDNVGQSGATIYRLYGKPDAPELFLKHGKGSVANDVTDEMVRLNWLTEFMPLPTIKHFIRTPDDAWLLTTAIPGKTAFQVLEEYPDSGRMNRQTSVNRFTTTLMSFTAAASRVSVMTVKTSDTCSSRRRSQLVCKRMPGADKPVRARQRVLAGVGAQP